MGQFTDKQLADRENVRNRQTRIAYIENQINVAQAQLDALRNELKRENYDLDLLQEDLRR